MATGNKEPISVTHPNVAVQAHGWDPTTVTAGSKKKREWQCEHSHIWAAIIKSRTSGRGCPVCAGKQINIGFNDLATTHPELAAEADGWDPTAVTAGSHKQRKWQCERGHTWSAEVASRTSMKSGCPYCANSAVLAGFNDLATTHPELAAEADGWDPTAVTAGSNKKREWQCQQGHVWVSTVGHRSQGQGCPFCAGKQVLIGFNDLATTHPELAAEAHGWDPTTVTAGSNKKREWQCQLGHIWTAIVKGRSGGQGCPTCAPSGFDPNSPGWIYLLQHDGKGLLQIGISNFPETRLASHSRGGWEALDLNGPLDGTTAREIEQAFLKYLDANSVPRAHTFTEQFDASGYTEAWRTEDLPVTSLSEVRDLIREWGSS
jgi:hypothetical protein